MTWENRGGPKRPAHRFWARTTALLAINTATAAPRKGCWNSCRPARGAPDMPEKDTSAATGADKGEQGTQTVEPPKAAPKKAAKPKHQTKQLPPYNVVLLDDDDH